MSVPILVVQVSQAQLKVVKNNRLYLTPKPTGLITPLITLTTTKIALAKLNDHKIVFLATNRCQDMSFLCQDTSVYTAILLYSKKIECTSA